MLEDDEDIEVRGGRWGEDENRQGITIGQRIGLAWAIETLVFICRPVYYWPITQTPSQISLLLGLLCWHRSLKRICSRVSNRRIGKSGGAEDGNEESEPDGARVSVCTNMDAAAPEFLPTSDSSAPSRPQTADVGKSSKPKRARKHKPKPVPRPGQPPADLPSSADAPVNPRPAKAKPERPKPSDQCEIITEQLKKRQLECVFCTLVIGWKGKIWCCAQCRQPQHLSCTQKWREKSGDSWPCPTCSYIYTTPPRYFCFCGKVENPNSAPGMQPHSCGETCGRVRGANCPHLCPLLCHPGQCPPCTSLSPPIQCYCCKISFQVMCKDNAKPKSCGQTCGKLLPCQRHRCVQSCHEGDCGDCRESRELRCHCGKVTKMVPCATKSLSCMELCSKPLSCGVHLCERVCHLGSCGRCPRDPALVSHCPCGKNPLSVLLIEERKLCTDPIPTCYTPCQQLLACEHQCQTMCHFGRCPPCSVKVTTTCRCGSTEVTTTCAKAGDAMCQKVCKTMKSCNKHKCDVVCCIEKGKIRNSHGKHLCFIVCDKTLSCGKHACPLFCHLGNCDSCKVVIREPLSCACGRTVHPPPIQCGSDQATVICPLTCGKTLPCGHNCRAKCHFDACPPCLELTTKRCKCGGELRDSIPCTTTTVSCGKICQRLRTCGHKCCVKCHAEDCNGTPCTATCNRKKADCEHTCQLHCHGDSPCPAAACQVQVKVACRCGAQFVNCLCSARVQKECDAECERIQRNAKLEAALACEKPSSEVYSPELLLFAKSYPDFVQKVDKKIQSILKSKEKITLLPPMNQAQRSFSHEYLTNHFELDTESVDREPNRTIVVYMTPRARLPIPLLSAVPVAHLDPAGAIEPREVVAHLLFYQLQMQDTTDELKSALQKFTGEFYIKWVNDHSAMACFYNLQRCMAAKEMLESRPGAFSVFKMVQESKLQKAAVAPPKKFSNSRKKAKEVADFQDEAEEAKSE